MMKETQQWTSKIGFVLAAAGAAVGLGAIWKFPYVAGNGGEAHSFLVFLLLTLFIGMPLLLAEFVIGRSTQKRQLQRIKYWCQIASYILGLVVWELLLVLVYYLFIVL